MSDFPRNSRRGDEFFRRGVLVYYSDGHWEVEQP